MTPAVDQWPAAARLVAVAAAGHSDPLLLHHLKGHDPGWRYIRRPTLGCINERGWLQ
jgi:hypothetical protein